MERPTAVQALAIPQMLQGHSVGFAGATGTGKTMAFLLPVVEQLRQHEKELPAARRSGDARALILAPTRALAVQIGLVAKSLSLLLVRLLPLAYWLADPRHHRC